MGLGCAWGLLSFGCSSSDSSSADPVALDQLPQKFASALCDGVEPCCKADDIAYSSSKCKQQATDRFTDFVIYNGLPGLTYDAQAAGACLKSLVSTLKSCIAIDAASSASCQHLFVGTLSVGSPCSTGSQCASGSCVDIDRSTNNGVCGSAVDQSPHAKLNEGCAGQCYKQEDGSEYCESSTNLPACHESDSLFCDYDTETCVAFAPIGASCSAVPCAAGGYCGDRQVCTAQRDSGACNADDGACSVNSYCTSIGVGGPGQCVAKKPDGFSCQERGECKSGQCSATQTCGAGQAASGASCSGSFINIGQP